jgi:hypothetical protein
MRRIMKKGKGKENGEEERGGRREWIASGKSNVRSALEDRDKSTDL